VWFRAAYLMAAHACGISALQLRNQLGRGWHKSAWLLCAKPRSAMMVDRERNLLSGLVETDETTINHRTNDTSAGGWSAYAPAPDVDLKSRALGVYHRLRKKHLQRYLHAFTFGFNRRRSRHAGFRSLLCIGSLIAPLTYNMLSTPEPAG
jgi:hypothetical protein